MNLKLLALALLAACPSFARAAARTAPVSGAPVVVAPMQLAPASLSGAKLMTSQAGLFDPESLPPVRVGVAAQQGAAQTVQPEAEGVQHVSAQDGKLQAQVPGAPLALQAQEPAALVPGARNAALPALTNLALVPAGEPSQLEVSGRVTFDGAGREKRDDLSVAAATGSSARRGYLRRFVPRAVLLGTLVPSTAFAQDAAQTVTVAAFPPVLLIGAVALLSLIVLFMPRTDGTKRNIPRSATVGGLIGIAAYSAVGLLFPAVALPLFMMAGAAGFWAGGAAVLARMLNFTPNMAAWMAGAAAFAMTFTKAALLGPAGLAAAALGSFVVARFFSDTTLKKGLSGIMDLIGSVFAGMIVGMSLPIWGAMWAGPRVAAWLKKGSGPGAAGFALMAGSLPVLPDVVLWVGGIAAFIGFLFGSIPNGDASRFTLSGALRGAFLGALIAGGAATALLVPVLLYWGLGAAATGAAIWLAGSGLLVRGSDLAAGANAFTTPERAKREFDRTPRSGMVSGKYWLFGQDGMTDEHIELMKGAFERRVHGVDAMSLLVGRLPESGKPGVVLLMNDDLYGLGFERDGLVTPYGKLPWGAIQGAIPYRYRSDG